MAATSALDFYDLLIEGHLVHYPNWRCPAALAVTLIP
jgi:hypothetical protein